MLKHILVPLDGSALAEKALDYAVQILNPNGWITLLSVIETPDVINVFHPLPLNLMMVEENLDSAKNYLARIAEELREKYHFHVNIEAKIGKPVKAITNVADAEAVDAIVMSTHGRTGVEHFMLGSVTQKVLHTAERPVFVVPGKAMIKAEDNKFAQHNSVSI